MKSFKQYLEESWKKYRDKERKRKGEYVNPFGKKLPNYTNKREKRLWAALNAHGDYEEHRNPQQRQREHDDIFDRYNQLRKNDEMRKVYRAAKMLGYSPAPGFGHLLHTMKNYVDDGGLMHHKLIQPLQMHFKSQSEIRSAANTPISDERRAREKESFERLIARHNHSETSEEHKEIIGRHLERNKTRMRKLGIKR